MVDTLTCFLIYHHKPLHWSIIHSQPDQENPAAGRSEGMATPFYNISISSAMGALLFQNCAHGAGTRRITMHNIPFKFFAISQRELHPGESYSPIIPLRQLVPTGPGPQGYTKDAHPCPLDQAFYIIHPSGMAFPGYHIVAGWDEQGNLLHFDAPRPKPQIGFSPGSSHTPFLSTPSSPFRHASHPYSSHRDPDRRS